MIEQPASNPQSGPSKSNFRDFCDSRKISHSGLRVIRTIGSDLQLIRNLRDELKLRDTWPDKDHPENHCVLITEHDSLYSTLIPETFGFELGDEYRDRLIEFNFLRGIDGSHPDDVTRKSRSDDEDIPIEQCEPKTTGRSQYDYLRRLQRQIDDFERSIKEKNSNNRISAIGVVCTDLYDKLLVLRALKARNPDTWFFTTDIDAAFSHPTEYGKTRNLLVASHFGLQLNRRFQRSVPRFRDSYQTSAYFGLKMALRNDNLRDAMSDRSRLDPWGLVQPKSLDDSSAAADALQPARELADFAFRVCAFGRRSAGKFANRVAVIQNRHGPTSEIGNSDILVIDSQMSINRC